MSLEELVAAVAAALGIVDEEQINNMSYSWFQNVLQAIGRRYNFESISNLYGNSFASDSGEVIANCNPLRKPVHKHVLTALAGALDKLTDKDTADADKQLRDAIGGFDEMLADFRKQNEEASQE